MKKQVFDVCVIGTGAGGGVMIDQLTAAGFSDEVVTLFAATDCTDVGQQVDGVEEAHMTVLRIPVAEVLAMAAEGRFRDSKTVIGLFWAQARGLLGP